MLNNAMHGRSGMTMDPRSPTTRAGARRRGAPSVTNILARLALPLSKNRARRPFTKCTTVAVGHRERDLQPSSYQEYSSWRAQIMC